MLAVSAALGAAAMDLRQGRVDNGWIVLFWILGFLYQLYHRGLRGILDFGAGMLLPIGALWLVFYFRMLGAGDIKLLSALGGIMGPKTAVTCMAGSFFLGAVLSIMILIICGNLKERLLYFIEFFREYPMTKQKKPYRREGRRMENFHFTIPILLSTFIYAGGFY